MITTSFFAGSIIIGLIGCSEYVYESNGILFSLIPVSLLTLVFGAIFTVTAGVTSLIIYFFL